MPSIYSVEKGFPSIFDDSINETHRINFGFLLANILTTKEYPNFRNGMNGIEINLKELSKIFHEEFQFHLPYLKGLNLLRSFYNDGLISDIKVNEGESFLKYLSEQDAQYTNFLNPEVASEKKLEKKLMIAKRVLDREADRIPHNTALFNFAVNEQALFQFLEGKRRYFFGKERYELVRGPEDSYILYDREVAETLLKVTSEAKLEKSIVERLNFRDFTSTEILTKYSYGVESKEKQHALRAIITTLNRRCREIEELITSKDPAGKNRRRGYRYSVEIQKNF